jgi:monoterpene epsilon-lactone hydrolase
MESFVAWLLLFVLVFVAFSYLVLRGENLDYLDSNITPVAEGDPGEAHRRVVASMSELTSSGMGLGGGKGGLQRLREYMDSMTDGRDYPSEFRPVDEATVKGEWILAPGADPRRRVLHIHGGAWMMGRPKSHRTITRRLSELAMAAVFSVDNRLLPENKRLDGIVDCQKAYRWILDNGPDGPEELDFLLVSGDSAGGGLALATMRGTQRAGHAVRLAATRPFLIGTVVLVRSEIVIWGRAHHMAPENACTNTACRTAKANNAYVSGV